MRSKVFELLAVGCCLLAAGCSSGEPEAAAVQAEYVGIDTVPMLVMQIQKHSRLYVSEWHVHKIVTHDDVVRLRGSLLKQDFNVKLPLGQRKVAIPIDATLKAYVDFSSFTEDNIERSGDRITVVLPDPEVELTSSKVNQEAIRSYVGLVRSAFSDEELSSYEQQGREAIIRSVPQLGIVDMAKENAARTIVPLLTKLGFSEPNITVTFRKDFKIRRGKE